MAGDVRGAAGLFERLVYLNLPWLILMPVAGALGIAVVWRITREQQMRATPRSW